MKADRYAKLLTDGPERIVSRLIDMRHIAKLHRRCRVDYALVAPADGSLDLRHGSLHRPNRNHALGHKARTHARPFIDQPIVVGLHAVELQIGILERPEPLTR